MKFRKKPIIIEATQWFKDGDHPKVELATPMGDTIRCSFCGELFYNPHMTHGWIQTLEGGHIVCPKDWIITGVAGEHYPCKPDIFEVTYEKV